MTDQQRIVALEAECHQRSSETSRIAARCDWVGEERDAARRQVTDLKAERDGLRQRLTEAEAAYASEHRRHSDLLGLLSEFFPPEADIRECLSTQRQRLTEADTAYRGLLQCCETHRQRVTELEAALEIEQIESETAAMDAQAAEKDKP